MMQDLFYIPSRIAGFPLFGFGWLFILWSIVGGGALLWFVIKRGWQHGDTAGQAVTFVVVAAVIVALGRMAFDARGVERGIPIRGYGLFLLLGIASGVLLATYRASRRGVSPELIQSLAMWLFVPGILGARLFFVIQNWPMTIQDALAFTEGGLVVYGSLVGAAIGFCAFCWRYRVPILPLADLITPSLLIGLALGRLGCLMNGCCFGGLCEYPWGITFPAHANSAGLLSPPYAQQLHRGILDGLILSDQRGPNHVGPNQPGQVMVQSVVPNSAAAQAGIRAGDVITHIAGTTVTDAQSAVMLLEATVDSPRTVQLANGHSLAWPAPARSRPIHPTQIYSSLNAAILLLFVLTLEPFVRRDGILIASALTLKPITRFLLEVIRADEVDFAGTGLTISQNVSLILLASAAGLWIFIFRRPQQLHWPVLRVPRPGPDPEKMLDFGQS